MTDVPTAVQAGVDAYAEAEKALQVAHDALLKLPATYAAIVGTKTTIAPPSGLLVPSTSDLRTTDFGYLESIRVSSRAQTRAGQIAALLADVIDDHQSDTARAQSLGIDLPQPDGGGR